VISEHKVGLDIQDQQVKLDLLDHKELKVLLDQLVYMDLLDLMDLSVILVQKVVDILDLQAMYKDLQVH
jgi:hypothetical protein